MVGVRTASAGRGTTGKDHVVHVARSSSARAAPINAQRGPRPAPSFRQSHSQSEAGRESWIARAGGGPVAGGSAPPSSQQTAPVAAARDPSAPAAKSRAHRMAHEGSSLSANGCTSLRSSAKDAACTIYIYIYIYIYTFVYTYVCIYIYIYIYKATG